MTADPPVDLDEFVRMQRAVVALERAAERAESERLFRELDLATLERRGHCVRRLELREDRPDLGDRRSWLLGSTRGESLPAHRFSAGDLVRIVHAARSETVAQGVVSRVRPASIAIAVDTDVPPPTSGALRLERLANEVTWQRMNAALAAIPRLEGRPAELRDVLVGHCEPEFDPPESLAFVEERLDESQREAVAFALAARDLALIHGPPGTGKTTALVELIVQCVRRGERILASAASNVAVDNLAERLLALDVEIVRIGHPVRVLPAVQQSTLDAKVERSEGSAHAATARRDLERLQSRIERASRDERRFLIEERRELRREIRHHERSAVEEVLATAQVTLCTHAGAAERVLRERSFDRVVLDEAAQALEASCWIPLPRGSRLVLAGDHLQLPPTLRARPHLDPAHAPLTLFERAIRRYGSTVSRMLRVQYRMHEQIMAFSSQHFYGGELIAHPSVATHRLCDLESVRDEVLTRTVLEFVDTAGCDFDESTEDDGDSRCNPNEARLAADRVCALLDAGVPASQIALITPYNAQVNLLRQRFADVEGLEIGSVDGFQGREKEAVVVSLVRSNSAGELGFLTDDRRTNVAFTRARRHLSVFGDSATLARHPLFAEFLDHCQRTEAWRSAWELL